MGFLKIILQERVSLLVPCVFPAFLLVAGPVFLQLRAEEQQTARERQIPEDEPSLILGKTEIETMKNRERTWRDAHPIPSPPNIPRGLWSWDHSDVSTPGIRRQSQFAAPGVEDAEQSPLLRWLFPRALPSGIQPLRCLPGGMDSAGPIPHPSGWGSSEGRGAGMCLWSCLPAREAIPDALPGAQRLGSEVGISSQRCANTRGTAPWSPGKTLLNLSDAKLCIISGQSRHRPPGIFGADIPGGKKGCIYKESAGELNQSS